MSKYKKIPDFSDLTGTLGDIYAFFVVTKENFVMPFFIFMSKGTTNPCTLGSWD